jgi:micrococcal nuclease
MTNIGIGNSVITIRDNVVDYLYHYKATVSRVLDGDTIEFGEIDLGFDIVLKRRKARLLGVNTKELKSKDEVEKKLAFEAKDYMTERLLGQSVIIKIREYDYADNFGRILADVYLENELINDTLIAEGFAVEFMD